MKNLQSLFSLSLLSSFAFVASLGLSHSALAMSDQKEDERRFRQEEAHQELVSLNSPQNYSRPNPKRTHKRVTQVEPESFNLPASMFVIPTRPAKPKKSLFWCISASSVQE